MRSTVTIILLYILLASCGGAYPRSKYVFHEAFRNLISPYKVGDTLIFKSSTNLVDSFVISGIDSVLDNEKKIFFPVPNFKTVTVYYRQIPVDKWQDSVKVVMENAELKDTLRDGKFISLKIMPVDRITEYRLDFKKIECSGTDTPVLHTNTILIDGYKFTNYYKLDRYCWGNPANPNTVEACYSIPGKGLVAYTTKGNVSWVRIN